MDRFNMTSLLFLWFIYTFNTCKNMRDDLRAMTEGKAHLLF